MPLRSLFTCLIFSLFLFSAACKKGGKNNGGNPTPQPQEEAIQLTLAGVEEGKYNKALDSTFTFSLVFSSKVPPAGVQISLSVVSDPGGIVLQQIPLPDGTADRRDVTLKGLKELKTYKVTLNVTSKSNNANFSRPIIFWITNKAPL